VLSLATGFQVSNAVQNDGELRVRSLVIEDADGREQMRLESLFGGGRILLGPIDPKGRKAPPVGKHTQWALEIRADLMGRPAIVMRDIGDPEGKAKILLTMDGDPAVPRFEVVDMLGIKRLSTEIDRQSVGATLNVRSGENKLVLDR